MSDDKAFSQTTTHIHNVQAHAFDLLGVQYVNGVYKSNTGTEWFELDITEASLTLIWFKEDCDVG